MQEHWAGVVVVLCILGLVTHVNILMRREGREVTIKTSDTTLRLTPSGRHQYNQRFTQIGDTLDKRGSSMASEQHQTKDNSTPCSVTPCKLGPLSLNTSNNQLRLTLRNSENHVVLQGNLEVQEKNKYEIQYIDETTLKLKYSDGSEAVLSSYKLQGDDCVDLHWRASKCVNDVYTTWWDLGTSHWYGGAELGVQLWPLEKAEQPLNAFVAQLNGYGPVQERWFFNSAGGGIYVQEDIPLFVSMNVGGDKRLYIQAKYDNYWYVSHNNTLPELNYTMCTAANVREIHNVMSDRFIKKPKEAPSQNVMRYPIWTTWAKYKTNINQTLVEDFVKDIKAHNFSISQVEIDDSWTTAYGDMIFDPKKFPDPKIFVDFVHSMNASVTLWVHPFINIEAQTFPIASKFKLIFQDIINKSPALTWWWHGNTAGHLDFSNPAAVKFFIDELNSLRTKYGIDSFKFDAGDVTFLPASFQGHQQFLNRNHYTRLYANTAHQVDAKDKRLEVRTGARTQDLPAFVRILDRSSTWSIQNGLKSVITTGLFFGIIGYPFLLPDIIGGNSYSDVPDPELLIRWIQANALMPVMQFSLFPWTAKNSTVLKVAQEMVQLHEKYADLIIQLANQSVTTGFPIMRPLWWIAPTDETALTVDDQFLVGDDLLVAPVVNKGETVRKLYLPAGRWRDENKGNFYVGARWLNYPVTLQDLPYFTRTSKST